MFEAAVIAHLRAWGVPVASGVRCGRWTFDGAVLSKRLLIEADGTFWHSSPRVQARDARKDQWCAANGFTLFRVREDEFRRDRLAACGFIVERWQNLTGKKATRKAG